MAFGTNDVIIFLTIATMILTIATLLVLLVAVAGS